MGKYLMSAIISIAITASLVYGQSFFNPQDSAENWYSYQTILVSSINDSVVFYGAEPIDASVLWEPSTAIALWRINETTPEAQNMRWRTARRLQFSNSNSVAGGENMIFTFYNQGKVTKTGTIAMMGAFGGAIYDFPMEFDSISVLKRETGLVRYVGFVY